VAEIVIESLYKKYKPGLFKKPVQAVAGLSLKVPAGMVCGLVGPNGAGKDGIPRLGLLSSHLFG